MVRNLFNRAPLREQAATHLRNRIISKLQPGERMPAESELARIMSVSVPVVREALALLAQQGLVQRQHGRGTFVTDRAKQRRIAVVTDMDVSNPRMPYFFLRVIRQARRFFREQGIEASLYVGDALPSQTPSAQLGLELFRDVEAGLLSGVVFVAADPPAQWLEKLNRHHVPFVGGEIFQYGVSIDYVSMVRTAAEYLISQGRRKIAFMDWRLPTDSETPHDPAYLEFVATLAKHGVPLEEKWIRRTLNPYIVGVGYQGFHEIWRASTEKPDALLICNDLLFREATLALFELGIRIPQQLMIAAHSNRGSDIPYPFPVARMECDPDLFAISLSQILLNLMNQQPVPVPRVSVPFNWIAPEDHQVGLNLKEASVS